MLSHIYVSDFFNFYLSKIDTSTSVRDTIFPINQHQILCTFFSYHGPFMWNHFATYH